MNESPVPTPEEVLEVLDRSGALMEQEVATSLEDLGFVVTMNPAYEDPDEGKSREYDVGAYLALYESSNRQTVVDLKFIVECKSSPNPYAFVARPRANHDLQSVPAEYHFPFKVVEVPTGSSSHREVSPFHATGLFRHDAAFTEHLKAVQFLRLTKKKTWEGDKAHYDSLILPLAKAVKSEMSWLPFASGEGGPYWVRFHVPVVVVRGPLFLLDSSVASALPVEVPFVTTARRLETSSVRGYFSVHFVQQDALSEFVAKQAMPLGRAAVSIAERNPERFTSRVMQVQPGDAPLLFP